MLWTGDPAPEAAVAPGAMVAFNVGGRRACNADPAQQLVWSALEVGLPDGSTVRVPTDFDISCGVSVSSFGAPSMA